MTEFIAAHHMDNGALMLADAGFWDVSQSNFIREALDDSGWAEISRCSGRPATSLTINFYKRPF